ncbi:sugar-binding domain-containing protein [Parabacteroides sp. Marseille-P3160]|uniref:glycoside hydrolase family 2 protein n=1 Tax=Parabacteroides sp. Marseille-P3160 TaxID=1917887 RepID=UPI0009B991D7|nr:sugar-binding domain-containing protein [Parabacteroides sp. Marseille-P3160]
MKIKYLLWIGFLFNTTLYAQEKVLESPYYVFPRTEEQHIDLSPGWLLSAKDKPVADLNELNENNWFTVAYPTSVQMAHFKAGKLGDPYKHLNAKEHEKLEQKVWYYKKEFSLPDEAKGKNILLNFDGIDYFAKIWLNGKLLGTHQGIFGGPVIEISKEASFGGNNELIVEVISANYNNPNHDSRKPGKIVKGWFLTGGSAMEPYFNLGMWRNIRIEIVPHYHLERPFLFTKQLKDNQADIGFSVELFSGTNSKDYILHPDGNRQLVDYSNPKTAPLNRPVKEKLKVVLELIDKGRAAYTREFTPYVIEGRCWLEEAFTLDHPKLWNPNGIGSPDYYKARVTLYVDGGKADCIEFDFGIRKIEQVRSAGIRTNDRWQDWQFVVNGQKIFVKGINWMPVDALYDLTADKYDWAIRMAKEAGIQMFRIWGSGLLESKEFYDACNKYGIMVWQDFCIANFDTPEWPQDVWEAQVCQNIFRLRNEPSLAVWCGGNEFNPYSTGNAASIGILERNLAIFDPTRPFLRTSPDAGSMHLYPDFDPSWYKTFDLVPYVAETGIHSITDARNIREVVTDSELNNLSGMYDKEFAASHPEFVEHFAEYNPARVPRMLSRASHIDDMSKPDIEKIAEATQVGAGEFYQVMSESFQGNYPITTGLMPWVYKRPWPVVAAIHLVDGYGQPSATYYFLKRTYEPTRISFAIERLLWAPGEEFPVKIKVLNEVNQPSVSGKVEVRILDYRFNEIWKERKPLQVLQGTSVTSLDLGSFSIPDSYKEKYFFAVASLYNDKDQLVSQAEYWPRTIRLMEDPAFYHQYSTEPVAWPALDKGPWLKPTVAKTKTSLVLSSVKKESFMNDRGTISFTVKNTGKNPSFMTTMDIEGCSRSFYANDNFFWLAPGESKQIDMEILLREKQPVKQVKLVVKSWNAKAQEQTIDY